ncbi:MAG: hypothetical protein ABSH28_10410 [Acidobacteriota bacterium]|jgi:hypothetical protein
MNGQLPLTATPIQTSEADHFNLLALLDPDEFGNCDLYRMRPLNAASVSHSSIFIEWKPDHVDVIENADPIQVADGIEIVEAAWMSKRPAANPIGEALNALPPPDGIIRLCAGHGAGELTAKWSEGHMKELLAEMVVQAKALQIDDRRLSIEKSHQCKIVHHQSKIGDASS